MILSEVEKFLSSRIAVEFLNAVLTGVVSDKLNECPIRFSLSSTFQHSPSLKSVNVENTQRMSDTLQLVVNAPYTQGHKNKSTFQVLNECPIRFSLSSALPTLNLPEIGQRLKCATNVRYASACRQRCQHSRYQKGVN